MESQPDSIQSQGGKARAEKLSADKLKAIASKGALARWGAVAIKKGNFQKEFGIDVDCYVLDDANKTAVISQRGMALALGITHARGDAFPRFMATRAMAETAGPELTQKLAQPIKFQWGTGGAELPPSTVHGYDVTILVDVCRAIVAAEPKLGPRQAERVKQAHVILNASAKWGIKSLVYALAGYNPTAEEVIKEFKRYVSEEAKKYEKEFPPELYQHWHRLYQIDPIVGRGRPWQFKTLTVSHVYYPLAKSNGRVLELVRAAKDKGGDRTKKLFQFLSEIGARALSRHLGRLLEMAEDSKTREEYEAKILKRFGGEEQTEFTLIPSEAPTN